MKHLVGDQRRRAEGAEVDIPVLDDLDAGLPPADPSREADQIERLRALARSAELDPDFSEKFLRFVIDEVIRHHERARGSA